MGSISIGTDQLAILAIGGVIVLGSLALAAFGAVWTWRWVIGGGKPPKPERPGNVTDMIQRLSSSPDVTAADLFVVKSNLLACVRQVEDLERRLRYREADRPGQAA